MTLWRLEPDESWKIVLDWGIGHEIETANAGLLGQAITAVRDQLASSRGDAASAAEARSGTTRSSITDLTIGTADLLERIVRSSPRPIRIGNSLLSDDGRETAPVLSRDIRGISRPTGDA